MILVKTGQISSDFLLMIKPRWEAGQCFKVNNGRRRTGEGGVAVTEAVKILALPRLA